MTPHILVVDDEPEIRRLVEEILVDEGYRVTTAADGAAARAAWREAMPDLALVDIWMPDVDGVTLLREWMAADGVDEEGGGAAASAPPPVIMMSGHATVETAVEATRLGASDFLEKPLSLARLLLTVRNALQASRLRRENLGLKSRLQPVASELTGRSAALQALREQTLRVADHDAPVLIHGEPGVGKQVLARYIHANSGRRDGPFVVVSSGAVARENIGPELFGSERDGEIHPGRLEQAAGGVLFLEEAGDLDLDAQTRLLSALEGGGFLRLGGVRPVALALRVIASTSRDLEAEARAGRFRETLYYRLNVVPLSIPPLRERGDDVPELLNYYIDFFSTHAGLSWRRFSTAALNRLRRHDWPGNVRELKNLVQRLLILGEGEMIGVDELEAALAAGGVEGERGAATGGDYALPLKEARERFERGYLLHHLRAADGNVSQTAERAGMERTNLYRKMKALGIDPKGS